MVTIHSTDETSYTEVELAAGAAGTPGTDLTLTDDGAPWFDRAVADRLAGVGMRVAAMSPDRFADWLAEVT